MLTIPPIKSGQTDTKRVIKVGGKSLLMTIRESSESFVIFIGGRNVICLKGQIMKQTSQSSQYRDTSIADLTHLEFNQECSLENDFVRGLDTRMIVRIFLSYVKNNYPHVKKVKFSDASYRRCDDGQNVELPEMSYVVHGKTWYERTFGAYLSDEDKDRFDSAHASFQDLKSKFTWAMMTSYIGKDSPYKTLFETSTTWADFFGAIQNDLGAAEFCSFLAPWLHDFMMRYMKFRFPSMTYLIDIGLEIPYKEEPYAKGGRSTRRRYKRVRGRDEQ